MNISKNIKTDYSALDDKELVKAIIQERDRQLMRRMQGVLYERYIERVFAKCITLVRNKNTAKDLAHDIMVKVFLNLSKFKGEATFYSWVYAITYNHCLNHLEKEKKIKLEDFEAHSFDIAVDEIELEHKILKDLKLSQLETLIEKIGEGERMILLMRYQDGMPVKQIAKTLSIGESAVKMRLKRSRDHLAELLKKYDHE
ncbi:MAG: RNA polymerase sigma factor [Bacteroidetes bacterium]|nr:MAG: RNA polymerase sigma factor [Bacteroidota bacterium]